MLKKGFYGWLYKKRTKTFPSQAQLVLLPGTLSGSYRHEFNSKPKSLTIKIGHYKSTLKTKQPLTQ